MEFYFTQNNNKSYFLVIINNLRVDIIRIDNRQKIWSGIVKNIFIGEHHLLNSLHEYTIVSEQGNSILLGLEKYKYMFIRKYYLYF